jgi:ferredoxin-type protein NapG
MSDDRVDRRRFFRAALGEILKPLEKKAAPLERALREFSAAQQRGGVGPGPARTSAEAPLVRPPAGQTAARGSTPVPPAAPRVWLRPPGALAEEQFADTCSRCGECVRVCPAQCIRIEADGRGGGLPFIDAETMPCVLCDGLLCMDKCPTGALVPTMLRNIDMGTAQWHESTCVRSRHEECTACIDQCPVGSDAIQLREGKVHVIEEGCVGCGVCEHYCPTVPKSITVTPRAARESSGFGV